MALRRDEDNDLKTRLPLLLLLAYLAEFALLGIAPYDRAVWWAENLPILLIVLGLVTTYRYHAFSNTAYLLMSCLIFLHTIGGHYTFERVPFGLVTDTFGFDRNHFDRLAHFTVGFYAFAIAELLLVKKLVCSRAVLYLFPLSVIIAVAASYEILEWLYAVNADGTAGVAVLGSQGDPWDAQKDMLADTLGAITALLLFYRVNRNPLRSEQS
jgi:putative membrane protein